MLEREWIASGRLPEIEQAFHETHARIYDFHDANGTIELVNLRLSAIGARSAPSFLDAETTDASPHRCTMARLYRP